MKNNTNFKGKTITFYSYKGGVGRSMSLVNIACLMANKQKKVLLIDWDLEAPGLHSFFNVAENDAQLGLVDLMTDVISYTQTEENNEEDGYAHFLEENLHHYIKKDVMIEGLKNTLDIIKAGKFDDGYTPKLNAIDWVAFYKNSPAFFRTFAQYLETQYDYILIDSRTGLSDTGGVCTMLMPQILVAVFALNHQNINGVIDVVKQSINYRFNSYDSRNLSVLPLPARIDKQNPVELQKWIARYTQQFQDLFKEIYMLDECNLNNYFNTAKIPYEPLYAYGENIPVLTEQQNLDNDFFISYHYAQFYKYITDTTPIWEILSAEQIEKNRTEAIILVDAAKKDAKVKKYEQAIDGFSRAAELDQQNVSILNEWGNTLLELARTKQGDESKDLYRQAIELYKQAIDLKPDYAFAFNNYGNALYNLAKISTNEDAENLSKQAIEKYKIAISLMPNSAVFCFNLGLNFYNLARTKHGQEAINLLHQAIEMYKQAIDLKPDYTRAFNNYGNALYGLAKISIKEEAVILCVEAIENYKKAVSLTPNNATLFFNLGLTFSYLARIEHHPEAIGLYHQSIELYKQAIALKPDYPLALNNYGNALFELAEMSTGKEAKNLYKKAIEQCRQAIALKPDYVLAFNNYGNALFGLAEISANKDAEDLYKQALEQYKQAVTLKPDAIVFNNYGGALCELAKIQKNKKDRIIFLTHAIEICEKAVALGGSPYNLACIYAILGKKQEALHYLSLSLSQKYITVAHVEEDSDWEQWRLDKDYLAVLQAHTS